MTQTVNCLRCPSLLLKQRPDGHEAGLHKKIPSIIPSKPIVQFKAIQAVTGSGVVIGRNFCEWGSGFGTAALLASLLGYDSVGVEIEPILVDFGQQLGADLGIKDQPVGIAASKLIPLKWVIVLHNSFFYRLYK